jgi:hypothetical protein
MAEPIRYSNEARYFHLNSTNPYLVDKAFIHGAFPRILVASRGPEASNESETAAGLHMRLDLICDDGPRFNPAIAAIPPSSRLASFAKFVGMVRAGGGREPVVYGGQASLPGDPEGGVDYHGGLLSYGPPVRRLKGEVYEYCELLLLDKDLNVLAQVGQRCDETFGASSY